ncbi:Nucleoid occlusion protein [Alteripontixanthobacter maritimus]|uniref:Nucleoid occlusion protein n=1 Tax=Alteripontixanthobacter maritimus TaxID=2161824 RepID=A0A369Q9I5_9SPHN|nr:ParB/RepB/Spo0J family partition protein [Alteripontixanthobacter maritimus]RDC61142.1 Nucleoid occlusion protein [Alteripontixanthobacter maritimus]
MTNTTDPIRFSVPARPAGTRKKLGKGLGALMGETRREEPLVTNPGADGPGSAGVGPTGSGPAPGAATASPTTTSEGGRTDSGLASLAISAIEAMPGQPRTYFDEGALAELAASIAARGVIQPIIVRPIANGRYQLVAGERRWRAAQKARLHEIPALVRDLEEREVMALALIENIQREDLNPIEEGRAYQRLSEDEDMTQAEIAQLVDKSRSHVANLQRLLSLPADVIEMVEGGALSMGHARALIGHDDAEALARKAVNDNLTVRDVERLARGEGEPSSEAGKGARRTARAPRNAEGDADIAAVQRHLEEFLGLSVRIKTDADPRSGAVTIRYRTLDQLDLVCQRLTGGDI